MSQTLKISDNEYYFIGKKQLIHYEFNDNKMIRQTIPIIPEKETDDFERELAEKVDTQLQIKLF